jgi:hypothetical protein
MTGLEEDNVHSNQSASDTKFLYSIVGAGSSIAVIFFLLLATMITLAGLLKKLNRK